MQSLLPAHYHKSQFLCLICGSRIPHGRHPLPYVSHLASLIMLSASPQYLLPQLITLMQPAFEPPLKCPATCSALLICSFQHAQAWIEPVQAIRWRPSPCQIFWTCQVGLMHSWCISGRACFLNPRGGNANRPSPSPQC